MKKVISIAFAMLIFVGFLLFNFQKNDSLEAKSELTVSAIEKTDVFAQGQIAFFGPRVIQWCTSNCIPFPALEMLCMSTAYSNCTQTDCNSLCDIL